MILDQTGFEIFDELFSCGTKERTLAMPIRIARNAVHPGTLCVFRCTHTYTCNEKQFKTRCPHFYKKFVSSTNKLLTRHTTHMLIMDIIKTIDDKVVTTMVIKPLDDPT